MPEHKCGEIEASCVCRLEEGHEGLHHCSCGGEWNWVDGKFVFGKFPGFNPDPDWNMFSHELAGHDHQR